MSLKFKGKSFKEMGVVVEEVTNILARAPIKGDPINIPGRDGSIYIEDGYSDYVSSLSLFITKNNLDEVKQWLTGEGQLEYNGRVTTARFYQALEPIRTSSIYKLDVEFIRAPFWQSLDDRYEKVTSDVTNNGTIYSTPLIKLTKNNSTCIDVSVNSIRFKYNFKDEPYVLIDCEEYKATYDNLMRNKQLEIGFEFPKLKPGKNTIKVHEGDAMIEIKRKDCWL